MSIANFIAYLIGCAVLGVFAAMVVIQFKLDCKRIAAQTKLYDSLREFVDEKGGALIYGEER